VMMMHSYCRYCVVTGTMMNCQVLLGAAAWYPVGHSRHAGTDEVSNGIDECSDMQY